MVHTRAHLLFRDFHRFQSISPGFVKTSIGATIDPENLEKLRALLGNTEGMVPEDIADAVVYVLSTPPHVQVHELMVYPVGQN